MRVRYRVVPERSRLFVEARSSLHPISVNTPGLQGFVELDGDDDAHAGGLQPVGGRIEIDTERVQTGNGLYDRELERRLEARKFSRIRGEVKDVKPLKGNRYDVRGNLSLHGVTRSVEGRVTVRIVNEHTLEIQGEQTFDMRDFGLEPPRLLMLRVYPDVKVRGVVIAERES